MSLEVSELFHPPSPLDDGRITERRHGFDGSSKTGQFPALPLSPTGPAASGWNATMPRINLAGSWLDLDSDNEDEPARAMQLTRRPRKRSTSPSHESSRNTLSSLKDKLLSRRSSMNFLKLASRPSP
ncbi:hypothetical protein H4S06_001031 [Coemansia sp. BCRC 34490]|nr:hypothetical protein LPJ72_005720 [Coemansia sp. Benny D160-2]KAJ2517681.1 hypothetical protein GGI11_003091 [Coemansia sp. RSA 2049]KAJ2761770.1 hypothetical protein H4S06_001031 [Coemansia sp. BCRC 34490]